MKCKIQDLTPMTDDTGLGVVLMQCKIQDLTPMMTPMKGG